MFGGYSPQASPRVRWSLGAGCQLPTETKKFDNDSHRIFFSGTYLLSKLYNNHAIQYTQSLISEDTPIYPLLGYRVAARPLPQSLQVLLYVRGNICGLGLDHEEMFRESRTVIWSAWRQLHSILFCWQLVYLMEASISHSRCGSTRTLMDQH